MMEKYGEKGFTLVEVLISLTIFAFGVLAVVNMQQVSTAINIKSRGMTEGVLVAQNKIEELSTLPYNDADLTDTDANGHAGFTIAKEDVDAANADHSDATDPRYTLFWNVEEDVPFVDTKKVRVVVRWNTKGVTSNFEIHMVKSNGA